MAGLATTFGSGAMTNSIGEIDNAGTMFVIGSNTTAAHPVISHRMRRAARNGATLIVVNPKEIDLVKSADYFVQPKPGSDTALLMGMCRYIVENDLHDKKFIKKSTEDFEEFNKSLEEFTPEFVEEITGVPWEQIALIARVFATKKPAAIFYAMGITQHSHGTDNVIAVANLAMLTGSVGKPSTGVNPLRGQNNVQGACDLGGLPNVYPGYQRVDDPVNQEKFEKAWGRELSPDVGLTHTEIFDRILSGEIKSLYMVGENPVLTEADAKHARKALEELDFLVSQDIFLSESAEYADVVLPAASFAEKEGSFTNTERRVQRVRQVIPPRGTQNRIGGSPRRSLKPWVKMDSITVRLLRSWQRSTRFLPFMLESLMTGSKSLDCSGPAETRMIPERHIFTKVNFPAARENLCPWFINRRLKLPIKPIL